MIADLANLTTAVTSEGHNLVALDFDLRPLNTQTTVNLNNLAQVNATNTANLFQLSYDLDALTPQITSNIAATFSVGVRVDDIDTRLANIAGPISTPTNNTSKATNTADNTANTAAGVVRADAQDFEIGAAAARR